MNFSQWIPQQLNLSTTAQIGLGVGSVVFLYLLVKLVQWMRKRIRASRATFKMRPKGTSQTPLGPTARKPATRAQETSSPVAPVTQTTSSQSVTTSATNSESDKTSPDGASDASSSGARKYPTTRLWPVEPKTFSRKNPFEELGEEYPWADGSDYALGSSTPVLSALLPESEESRRALTKTLRNAGYYSPHAWQNLAAIRYLGIVLPILIFGALLVVVPETLEPYVIAGIVIGPILGWALPTLYVRSRAAERVREIENAMPDMLDLLNMCVAQGMTIPASLRRVSTDMAPVYPALSKELTIVAEQARVGNLTEALQSFSNRVENPEVHSFTSLLIQTEQMGTSVSEALEEYSDNMRESQRQRADQKANSASFKLLFPTVLCLMPAVFLFLMGPALIELNEFFSSGGLEGLDGGGLQAIQAQEEQ